VNSALAATTTSCGLGGSKLRRHLPGRPWRWQTAGHGALALLKPSDSLRGSGVIEGQGSGATAREKNQTGGPRVSIKLGNGLVV